jgi:hypothetical protein
VKACACCAVDGWVMYGLLSMVGGAREVPQEIRPCARDAAQRPLIAIGDGAVMATSRWLMSRDAVE